MTPTATIPQVPAALCGLFSGANVVLCTPDIPEADGEPVVVLGIDAHLQMFEATVDFQRRMFGIADASLLLDSPLAMCHAARWLATRLGMDPGATAPKWYRIGGDDTVAYELQCRHRRTVIVHDDDDGPTGEFDGTFGLRVHGLNEHKGSPYLDAIVLAAACVAVGGAS